MTRRVTSLFQSTAQPPRARRVFYQVRQNDDLPRKVFDRLGECPQVAIGRRWHIELIGTADVSDRPGQRAHGDPTKPQAALTEGQHGL